MAASKLISLFEIHDECCDWPAIEELDGCDRLGRSILSSDWPVSSSGGGVSLDMSAAILGLDKGIFALCPVILSDDVPLNFLSFGARLFLEPSLWRFKDRSIPESPSESVPIFIKIVIDPEKTASFSTCKDK